MNYHKRSFCKSKPVQHKAFYLEKKRSPSFNSSATSGAFTSDEEKQINHFQARNSDFFFKKNFQVLKIMQDGQVLEEDLIKIKENGNFCASELTVAPNVKKISLPTFL